MHCSKGSQEALFCKCNGNLPAGALRYNLVSCCVRVLSRLRFSELSVLAQCAPKHRGLQQLAASQDLFTDWAANVQVSAADLVSAACVEECAAHS